MLSEHVMLHQALSGETHFFNDLAEDSAAILLVESLVYCWYWQSSRFVCSIGLPHVDAQANLATCTAW